jgi:hypothetical protein
MRRGLRIVGARGNAEVRGAIVRFARWLRTQYDFPMRVPVYLRSERILVNMHGERCTATFFAPWNRKVEPYIRIATGDYPQLKRQLGRDNALSGYLGSLAHEVIHYQQWIKANRLSEKGVARDASRIVVRYSRVVARP